MASFVETICVTIGLLCSDPVEIEKPGANSGDIDPDFYKRLEVPEPVKASITPGILSVKPIVDFGPTVTGTENRVAVELGNTGEDTISIQALSVSGSSDFTLNGFCNVIAANSSCVVETIFRPSIGGRVQSQLLIGVNGNIHTVQLSGVGMIPPPAKKEVVKVVAAAVVKKVVKRKPVVKKVVPQPDFELAAAVQTMDMISSDGPSLFGLHAVNASDNLSVLPSVQDRYRLQQLNYQGNQEGENVDKAISSLPVDRCRMVPKFSQIPLVLDSPINSQICGTVLAHVATDIYGPDGKLVLLPAMTPVEGSCEPLDETDATRIKVEFTEITRSDGAKITFKGGRGMDAMGQEGIVGEQFERTFEKRGATVGYSGLAGLIAFITAGDTSDDGTTVDSPLSAAGEAVNQNIAQIIAEEIRDAQAIKPRIRVRAGTLMHLKPPAILYFQNPPRILAGAKTAETANFTCNNLAYKDTTGTDQNP